jgi:hypothetical protein
MLGQYSYPCGMRVTHKVIKQSEALDPAWVNRDLECPVRQYQNGQMLRLLPEPLGPTNRLPQLETLEAVRNSHKGGGSAVAWLGTATRMRVDREGNAVPTPKQVVSRKGGLQQC